MKALIDLEQIQLFVREGLSLNSDEITISLIFEKEVSDDRKAVKILETNPDPRAVELGGVVNVGSRPDGLKVRAVVNEQGEVLTLRFKNAKVVTREQAAQEARERTLQENNI